VALGSLTGLTAATVYFYALRGTGEAVEGAERACHAKLKTHPPRGDTGALRFWALGDSGDSSNGQYQQLTFRAYRTFVGELSEWPLTDRALPSSPTASSRYVLTQVEKSWPESSCSLLC
jgi:hypothetical protein